MGPPLRDAFRFFSAVVVVVVVVVVSSPSRCASSPVAPPPPAAVARIAANLREGVNLGTHPARLSSARRAVATRMRSAPAPEDLSARMMASCSS